MSSGLGKISKPRLLDLFCCQGGASAGYVAAGFEVVGVDLKPQPRYPFDFVQGEAVRYLHHHWHEFDAVHASPPCQAYSATQRLRGNEHPELIADMRWLLKATGLPYVIENVMDARKHLRNPVMLCGAMFPSLRVYRHRLFRLRRAAHLDLRRDVLRMQRDRQRPVRLGGEWVQAVGNFSGVQEAREAMGMPWASREGLREAIPPAFTRYIGTALQFYLAAHANWSPETARRLCDAA